MMGISYSLLLILGLVTMAMTAPTGEGSSSSESGSEERKKPHMVYVLVDEWGNNEIGYNSPFFKTPIMDELAATGIKLTHFYAASMCTPSRARLMTGKHETRYGLQSDVIRPDTPYGLPLDLETMAERFRALDYSTHLVGKWHLGHHRAEYTPLNRGFDTFYGYLNGIIDYFNHSLPCPSNFSSWGYDMWDNWDRVPVAQMDGVYDAFMFTEQAEKVIKEQDPDKPMFLYLSSHDVHFAPYLQAPQKYIDMYSDAVADMPPAQANFMSRLGAKVTAVDDMVGAVVEALKENNMWNDTVLIVTTDNGRFPRGFPDYFVQPLLQPAPSEAMDGRQRGPAFVNSPFLPASSRGLVIDELTTICDFFPTMLNLAGDDIDPAETDGQDLWNMFVNGAASTRKEYLMMIDHGEAPVGQPMFPGQFDTTSLAAIRIGDYKLVTGCYDFFSTTFQNGTYVQKACHKFWETHHRNYFLFNIRADPGETTDLAEDPVHEDRIKHMITRLTYYDSISVPALHEQPEARGTLDACPDRMPVNDGRKDKYYGPYATGPDWQVDDSSSSSRSSSSFSSRSSSSSSSSSSSE